MHRFVRILGSSIDEHLPAMAVTTAKVWLAVERASEGYQVDIDDVVALAGCSDKATRRALRQLADIGLVELMMCGGGCRRYNMVATLYR